MQEPAAVVGRVETFREFRRLLVVDEYAGAIENDSNRFFCLFQDKAHIGSRLRTIHRVAGGISLTSIVVEERVEQKNEEDREAGSVFHSRRSRLKDLPAWQGG